MKYVALIDYKVETGKMFDYVAFEAADLIEAMDKATEIYENGKDEIYLIKILKKTGRVRKEESFKVTTFVSILAKRGNGWRTNKESETECFVNEYASKGFTFYKFA